MSGVARKVAMLGMWGVGKTSLVRRFVSSLYDEAYHSTIGVKVDKKLVELDGESMTLVLWDIAGAEDDRAVPLHYLGGAAGYLLVMDGTRRESLEVAQDLVASVEQGVGAMPFVPVVNKADLDWALELDDVRLAFADRGCEALATSAKTGENVEAAFLALAARIRSRA
jgi:small GTP-binding protein